MKNVNSNSENLFSVGNIEDSFSGRQQVRRLINLVSSLTGAVYAEAKKPFYQPSSSLSLMKKVSGSLQNLTHSDDWFFVSFNCMIGDDSDSIFQLLVEMWFDYEQPFFCFCTENTMLSVQIESAMNWQDIVELAPCIVLFRSAEEDVVWIGKSQNIAVDVEESLENL